MSAIRKPIKLFYKTSGNLKYQNKNNKYYLNPVNIKKERIKGLKESLRPYCTDNAVNYCSTPVL